MKIVNKLEQIIIDKDILNLYTNLKSDKENSKENNVLLEEHTNRFLKSCEIFYEKDKGISNLLKIIFTNSGENLDNNQDLYDYVKNTMIDNRFLDEYKLECSLSDYKDRFPDETNFYLEEFQFKTNSELFDKFKNNALALVNHIGLLENEDINNFINAGRLVFPKKKK